MSGRRRKRRKRFVWKILSFLMMALAMGAVFVCLFMFRLSDIHVTGNYHESDGEVLALVQKGPLRNNTLFLSLFFTERKIKGDTFIDTVDIEYVKHDTVSVKVHEKNLVGYVKYQDSYWYFDRSGKVLVNSPRKESDYKAIAEGKSLPEESPAEDHQAASSISQVVETTAKTSLAGEDTYMEPETAAYDETYEEPDEQEYDDEEDPEDEYGEDAYDAEETYDGYDSGDDDGEDEDQAEDVILIQPELTGDADITPIPAEEFPDATPIPAEEILSKEYTSEDTFAENYIPEITGLSFTEAVVGERLPAKYAAIYEALSTLKEFAERNSIYPTYVDISSSGELLLHFNDVTVNIGKGGEKTYDRLEIFRQIMEKLLGRSGVLHLEAYEGNESRLIFSKNEKNS